MSWTEDNPSCARLFPVLQALCISLSDVTIAADQQETSSREWNIRSILSRDTSSGRCGRTLRRRILYESSGFNDDIGGFWEIDSSSIIVCSEEATFINRPMISVSDKSRNHRRLRIIHNGLLVTLNGLTVTESTVLILQTFIRWCFGSPGVEVTISGAGKLSSAPLLLLAFVRTMASV